jgi:hypothetical protein
MKRILHLSHHVGCFRDQQYVLENLGFEVHNEKFQDNVFEITKEVSDKFWAEKKDYINSFDYVLTSDTAALSRIFFDHYEDFRPKLVVWICNRFDYSMGKHKEFYEYFRNHRQYDRVRIIPSTLWEKIWCLRHNIDILASDVISPLGRQPFIDESIPRSKQQIEWYGDNETLPDADIIVPFYHNDNVFFKMGEFLKRKNLSVYNGTFTRTSQLRKYKAVVTQPDTFCKWLSFECIQHGVPVVIPSIDLLSRHCITPGYLFNVTGYGGAQVMTSDLLRLSDWYYPLFEDYRFHFNSYDEIPDIIRSIDVESYRKKTSLVAKLHEKETLLKWKRVYDSF